jgi:hypothetical protein
MAQPKAKRKLVDWDSIEPLFKLEMNNCDICRQYEADHVHSQVWKLTVAESAIRKKAKENGWKKNLAPQVKQQIKEHLVRDEVRDNDDDSHQPKEGLSDNEIVDRAAKSGSSVILRHRKEIVALLELEDELLDELKDKPMKSYVGNYQGDIITKEFSLTVTEKSTALKNLAAVRAQRITLERQAHNLDDEVDTDKKRILVSRSSAETGQ